MNIINLADTGQKGSRPWNVLIDPKYLRYGNEIVTSKLAIVNHFNSFFTNIGPKLSKLIKVPEGKNYKQYLNNKLNLNFKFKPVNTKQISDIIDKLKPKTSSG